MKSLLILIMIFLGSASASFGAIKLVDALSAVDTPECPAGSYNIGVEKNGEPLCKIEPTGCPYGDSIPLGPECDKHAPEQAPVAPQTNTPSTNNAVVDTNNKCGK